MRKLQIILAVVAVVILSGFTYYGFHSGVAATSGKLNMSIPKLQSTEEKLKGLNLQYEKLNVQLKNQSSTDKEQIEKLKQEQEQNLKQQEDLKAQLQARIEQKQKLAEAAVEAENKLTATATVHAQSYSLPAGSHTDWMAQAGIDPANYGYVDYIVSHESGWNPNAVNASSGACGLGQQLPCGKWAGAWNDPIAALVAMNGYVNKFGGWAGAYNYWITHGNY